ncbi:hypothetical protein TFLX_04028 [Thermoflexales bacterium]|nr:hypothetical protein TFLX_04028 [Thermoflexales bacterium]
MSTANATDKPKPEHKRGERPMLSPETALEIIQTSLDYAKGSGLTVKVGNHRGVCVIAIGGAFWDSDTHALCVIPRDDTQPTMTHTGVTV